MLHQILSKLHDLKQETTVSHENSAITNVMNARKVFWADMFEHKCFQWNKPFCEMQSLLIDAKIEEFLWSYIWTRDDRSGSPWLMLLFWIPQRLVMIWGPSHEVHASVLSLIGSSLFLGEYFLSCGCFQSSSSSTVHSLQVRTSFPARQFCPDLNVRPQIQFWENHPI